MTLKIVVCIGSDGFEDVFSDDGPGWRCQASDVDVGPNGRERANVTRGGIRRENLSNGRAVGSDRRWNCDSMPSGVLGCKYPAWANAGDRARANSLAITFCGHVFCSLCCSRRHGPQRYHEYGGRTCKACWVGRQVVGVCGGCIEERLVA
jgi:hypothetical protein